MIKRIIGGVLLIILGLLVGANAMTGTPFDMKEVLIMSLGYSLPLLIIGIVLLRHRKDDLFFNKNKKLKIGFGIVLMLITFYVSHVIAIAECAGSKRCISSSGYPFPLISMGSDVAPGLLEGLIVPVIGLVFNYIFHFVLACAILGMRNKKPVALTS